MFFFVCFLSFSVCTWNSWSSFLSIQSVTWAKVTSLSPSFGRALSSKWGGLRKPYLTTKRRRHYRLHYCRQNINISLLGTSDEKKKDWLLFLDWCIFNDWYKEVWMKNLDHIISPFPCSSSVYIYPAEGASNLFNLCIPVFFSLLPGCVRTKSCLCGEVVY